MRNDRDLAIKLRKSGQSYSQISLALKIPKSTLSVWLKDLVISNKARRKIQARTNSLAIASLIARNKNQTIIASERHNNMRKSAKYESRKMLSDPLFLAGTSLYWAEGYKRGASNSKWKSLDFANSDPDMVKLMVKFFTKFLNLKKDQIKIQLMIHNLKDANKSINFWHRLTGVPKGNFMRTCSAISRSSLQKRNKNLQYGTIHLRVNDVNHFFRLIGWIDGLKEKLK
ncbi:MAG: hypothetical protein WC453_00150 [Patescibacteria group bacterium]